MHAQTDSWKTECVPHPSNGGDWREYKDNGSLHSVGLSPTHAFQLQLLITVRISGDSAYFQTSVVLARALPVHLTFSRRGRFEYHVLGIIRISLNCYLEGNANVNVNDERVQNVSPVISFCNIRLLIPSTIL